MSKAFGESLAAHYAYKHGIRAFCMRIGTCKAAPDSRRALSTWLSPEDLDRLVMVGLTASYSFEIVYGVSRNSRAWWDNGRACRLGYDPQDDAELYADRLGGEGPAEGPAAGLQGGASAARGFSSRPDWLGATSHGRKSGRETT